MTASRLLGILLVDRCESVGDWGETMHKRIALRPITKGRGKEECFMGWDGTLRTRRGWIAGWMLVGVRVVKLDEALN